MKFMKNEEAFTGLEAAIVLIAFVVVAAVFSYVMLGAGFFTSQKSQEVVHTSVQQASSSVEVVGNVVGTGVPADKEITRVSFTLSTTAGGGSFDLSNLVLTYTDKDSHKTIDVDPRSIAADDTYVNAVTPDAGTWAVTNYLNQQDGTLTDSYVGDVLIEPGEQVVIEVDLNLDAGKELGPNTPFSIELRPAVGSSLLIKRTAPPQIDAVNILY